jgi:hypothetical protein
MSGVVLGTSSSKVVVVGMMDKEVLRGWWCIEFQWVSTRSRRVAMRWWLGDGLKVAKLIWWWWCQMVWLVRFCKTEARNVITLY